MDDPLTLRRALNLVEEVVSRAEAAGDKLCVAVFDAGENLLAFARMEGALLGSIEVAVGKACTAAAFEMRTSELAALVVPGAPLYGLQCARPGIVAVGGGAPLRSGERVVGALGISGGTVPDDTALAESLADRF